MEIKQSSSPTSFIDSIVVPGDVVLDLSSMTNQTIKLGGGLRQDCDAISAMKYVPCVEDTVLGIVVDSKADNFLIDIKGPALAFLPVLAFEGGTRRNIPKFEEHYLLRKASPVILFEPWTFWNHGWYSSLSSGCEGKLWHMNPELSCTDSSGKAAEFGPLKDGYMFETSTALSRKLLSLPTYPVLEALGKKLSFEIAVGLNGRVWVNAASPDTIVVAANAIMNSESLSTAQQIIMVEDLLKNIQ